MFYTFRFTTIFVSEAGGILVWSQSMPDNF